VWLTVTCKPANAPMPDTVTAESNGAASAGAAEAGAEPGRMPITACPAPSPAASNRVVQSQAGGPSRLRIHASAMTLPTHRHGGDAVSRWGTGQAQQSTSGSRQTPQRTASGQWR
jgi:hypothetical protein